MRSEEHTSELQSQFHLVCRLFFNDPATPEIYTLSLHDALPISRSATSGALRPSAYRQHRHAHHPNHSPHEKSVFPGLHPTFCLWFLSRSFFSLPIYLAEDFSYHKMEQLATCVG